jgi:hypothetical protein
MTFRVGMKVVCISDNWQNVNGGTHFGPIPRKGDVSTVTGKGNWHGAEIISLDGFNSMWAAVDFRPAVEPSIEIFTAMLKKTRKENVRLARRPVKEDA